MLWGVSTYAARSGAIVPASAQSAAVDALGNLYVSAADGPCVIALKYTGATGALAWRREACGAASASAVAIALDMRGDVVVAANADGHMRVLKYSGAAGAPMWELRAANGALDVAHGLALDAAGDIFLLGKAAGDSTELWVAKHRGSDGSLAWQQPVDGGAETAPVGIAVDGGGDPFIVGNYRDSGGDDDWYAAKLAGSSGAVLWRKVYDSGRADTAAAIAIDAVGDFTVAGASVTAAGNTTIRTVKSYGTTGRTVWDRTLEGSANARAYAVAVDTSGNVAVTGVSASSAGGDDIKTLKYSAGAGTLLWQAAHTGSGTGPEAGRAIAVDARGDVAVTGTSRSAAGAELRTLKYAGGDGATQWSYGGTSSGDSGFAVVPVKGGTYSIGMLDGVALRVVKLADGAVAQEPANVQGLWWKDSSESGWGVNLTQQGDVLFATWFTYDENGHGLWLVMSRGERVGDASYQGTLYRMRGPAFNAVPFDPARVAATPVGAASFSFTDAEHGLFRYTVNGVAGSKAITRQVFSTLAPACGLDGEAGAPPNYQDLWWSRGGAESGWGLNVAHQGDTLFVTWFTYAGDGSGQWLVGSAFTRAGPDTYSGTLYRTDGPPFDSAAWNPAKVAVAAAGHATLTFSDADNGTFAYTLDGISQSKPIERQVFATPRTTCR
ncbi:MAG: hypothetical protein ABIR73_13475 [Usitatibacter sp.]